MDNDGRDTSLGGGRRDFPTTLWSQFLADGTSLDHLARTYWKPVYSYIRLKWSRSNDEAKDRTQDFFLWMMESGFLSKTDPGRGRFRTILKIALDHYLINHERMKRSIKRGGGKTVLGLDRADVEPPAIEVPDPAGRTPDQIMDEAWKQEILRAALEHLERILAGEGRSRWFGVFRDFCEPGSDGMGYKELAAKYGMSLEEVAHCIRTVRKRCRGILSDIVSETVSSREELEAEMNWLFGETGP